MGDRVEPGAAATTDVDETAAASPAVHAMTVETAAGRATLVRATLEQEGDGETVTVIEDVIRKDGETVLHRRRAEQDGDTITHARRIGG